MFAWAPQELPAGVDLVHIDKKYYTESFGAYIEDRVMCYWVPKASASYLAEVLTMEHVADLYMVIGSIQNYSEVWKFHRYALCTN